MCRMFRTIVLTLMMGLCFSTLVSAQDTGEKTRVRVGYIDYQGFIEQTQGGEYIGYGAEYLDQIAEYENLEYEYVHGSWSELLEQLKTGELDLLCHAQYTKDRAQDYIFSKHSVGIETDVIYARMDAGFYFHDYEGLNGSRIGVLSGSYQTEVLKEYAKRQNFQYTEVSYENESDAFSALQRGQVDAVAMGSLAKRTDVKVICNFGAEPYYFITGKMHHQLMEQINQGLDEIKINDKYFEADLYSKYYGNSAWSTQVPLTREEQNYIEQSPVLRVALGADMQPMAYINQETGQLTGITPALLDKIAEKTGLQFEYVPLAGQSAQYVYDYFRQNNIALIAGVEVNEFNEHTPGLTLTDPYFTGRKVMVGREGVEVSAEGNYKIAIVGGSGTLPYVIEKEFPAYELKTYDSIEACLKAVKSGDADVMMDNQYLIEKYLTKPQYEDLTVVPGIELPENQAISTVNYLDETDERRERLSNPCLKSILNKAIGVLSKSEIDAILIQYTVVQRDELSFGDVLYKYRYTFMALGFVVLVIITAFAMILWIKQRHYQEMNRSNEHLKVAIAHANDANAAKSQFLAQMSHEIRTPMNGIIGLTAIARSELENRRQIAENLDKIEESSKVLLDIINDVLDMSAIENNKLKLSYEEFDLKEVLESIASMYHSSCKQKKIEFNMVLEHMTEEILVGDALRVKQILLNLLSNAVKFTPAGGKVSILISQEAVRENQVFFKFTISDTGCGISEDMKNRLFKPFEQESADTARKHGGSGLGLSITKSLVTLMKGAIRVESVQNQGTVFTVDLPFDLQDKLNDDEYEKSAVHKKNYDFSGHRALLAEDVEINREVAAKLLENVHVETVCAKNGKEAVDLFESSEAGTFDVILMDVNMPLMDGYEATRIIRSSAHIQAKSIPIYAMTANAFTNDIADALAAGMDGHIAKPIDTEVLFATLEKVFQQI